ncbi:colicin E1 family microcin immunity protein [Serratia liquefaciens]|uniref:colicin E1 family microcin immunity protein n=1 Tax=Serratia liquefaciens TaxID=614 RepID=UPI0021843071|nr:colicin E1 family microcin immunity protein [Serratia liquefaciens]CAI2539784.1 Colicin E1 (microcin) immunity protein [Serratia liquefaciens]
MTWGYYFKSIGWALFFLGMVIYDWSQTPEDSKVNLLLILSLFSFFLYPFSKMGIEVLALRFTTEDFWHRGLFKDTIGKSGLYALYYFFCFLFSIPIGIVYICYFIFSRKAE